MSAPPTPPPEIIKTFNSKGLTYTIHGLPWLIKSILAGAVDIEDDGPPLSSS